MYSMYVQNNLILTWDFCISKGARTVTAVLAVSAFGAVVDFSVLGGGGGGIVFLLGISLSFIASFFRPFAEDLDAATSAEFPPELGKGRVLSEISAAFFFLLLVDSTFVHVLLCIKRLPSVVALGTAIGWVAPMLDEYEKVLSQGLSSKISSLETSFEGFFAAIAVCAGSLLRPPSPSSSSTLKTSSFASICRLTPTIIMRRFLIWKSFPKKNICYNKLRYRQFHQMIVRLFDRLTGGRFIICFKLT